MINKNDSPQVELKDTLQNVTSAKTENNIEIKQSH